MVTILISGENFRIILFNETKSLPLRDNIEKKIFRWGRMAGFHSPYCPVNFTLLWRIISLGLPF